MVNLLDDPDCPKVGRHRELEKAEIKKSEEAVQRVITAVKNFTNPFSISDKDRLYSLASGAPVRMDVEQDLFQAAAKGNAFLLLVKSQQLDEPLDLDKLMMGGAVPPSCRSAGIQERCERYRHQESQIFADVIMAWTEDDVNTTSGYPEVQATLSQEEYIGFGVYLVITGVFGGVGNTLVVVMFVVDKQLTSSVDLLLLNLAIADVAMCGCCFPFVSASTFAQHWLFGEAGCTVYGYLGFLFGNAAICTLTAISVQRYLVVCKRRSNGRGLTTAITIVFIWLQSITWSSLPLLLPKPYALEPFGTSCSVAWATTEPNTRIFIYTMASWVLFHFIVLAGCYVSIFLKTRRDVLTTSSRGHQDLLVSKVSSIRPTAALKVICFVLVVAFIVCWSPYTLFSLWFSSFSTVVPPIVTILPVMLAKVSACINPFLYIVVSTRFRNKYLSLIWCQKTATVDIPQMTQPTEENPAPSSLLS
ncbi:visual pigment-like receptor peropsin [Littorina saxatilis]|uniref:visual pigment-like receptor peropsin n=1 Tax=Littorina saxatilis TaxID=31220 RepID=UPI0038B54541